MIISFKKKHLFFLLIFVFITSSCGVEGPPKPPSGSAIPSIIEKYTLREKVDNPKDKNTPSETEKKKTKSTK